MCECCDLTAKRLTCTGIGTTIFVEPEPLLLELLLMPCDVNPALTLFHFALLFYFVANDWFQINKLNKLEQVLSIFENQGVYHSKLIASLQ